MGLPYCDRYKDILDLCVCNSYILTGDAFYPRKNVYLRVIPQIHLFQFLKRINPKNIAVLRFQRDTLMIHDDLFHAIEQQFDSPFFLWIWHDIENVHPVLLSASQ